MDGLGVRGAGLGWPHVAPPVTTKQAEDSGAPQRTDTCLPRTGCECVMPGCENAQSSGALPASEGRKGLTRGPFLTSARAHHLPSPHALQEGAVA